MLLFCLKIRLEKNLDKPNYSEQEKKLIYIILLLISKYLHNAKINCILDDTFNDQKSREGFRKELNLTDGQFKIVECICSEEILISIYTFETSPTSNNNNNKRNKNLLLIS